MQAFHDAVIEEAEFDRESSSLYIRCKLVWPHQPSTVYGTIRVRVAESVHLDASSLKWGGDFSVEDENGQLIFIIVVPGEVSRTVRIPCRDIEIDA